jgi:hypothetical protein
MKTIIVHRAAPRVVFAFLLAITASTIPIHAQLALGLPGQRVLGQRHLDVSAGTAGYDVMVGRPSTPPTYFSEADDFYGYRYGANVALSANFPVFAHLDLGLSYAQTRRDVTFGAPDGTRDAHDLIFTAVAHLKLAGGAKPFAGLVLGSAGSGLGAGVELTRGRVKFSPGIALLRHIAFGKGETGVVHLSGDLDVSLGARSAVFANVTFSDFLDRREWVVARGSLLTGRLGLRFKW